MVGAYDWKGSLSCMAVAIALIITFAYVHFSGGRLAFGTNPFPTAAKRRETVMIEGQMGAEYEC